MLVKLDRLISGDGASFTQDASQALRRALKELRINSWCKQIEVENTTIDQIYCFKVILHNSMESYPSTLYHSNNSPSIMASQKHAGGTFFSISTVLSQKQSISPEFVFYPFFAL